jgi:hypothetical protein
MEDSEDDSEVLNDRVEEKDAISPTVTSTGEMAVNTCFEADVGQKICRTLSTLVDLLTKPCHPLFLLRVLHSL